MKSISPDRFFLFTALIFGTAFAVVTAPFQSPDEPAHFLRIWQLSEGQLVADHYGGTVPASLGDCFIQFEGIKTRPDRKVPLKTIINEFRRPLDSSCRTYALFANTAIYSPIPYAPQVLAVYLGRHLRMPPIALMYLARIANAVVYATLGYFAIRLLPFLKWPACAILLSPLPLFLAGSLSADPTTTALTFLTTAALLRLASDQRPAPLRIIGTFAISWVALTLCKWTYFPCGTAICMAPTTAWGSARRRWINLLVIFTVGAFLFLCWSSLADPMHAPLRNPDPSSQLHWVEKHPVEYLLVICRTVGKLGPTLVWSSIGILGCLDEKLSPAFVVAYLLFIAWSAMNDSGPTFVTPRLRSFALVSVAASCGLIVTCEYLAWNSPGFPIIEGLQGRYFIPISLLALVVIRGQHRYQVAPAISQAIIISGCLYATAATTHRYYVSM